jgi:hypothetical protein
MCTTRAGLVLRVRAVENPVYLRIKAVCNVVRKEGIVLDAEGQVKEGTLGAGKERVLQVAFEGIGRSWLGCQGVCESQQQQQQQKKWRVTNDISNERARERERGRREGRGKARQWWC